MTRKVIRISQCNRYHWKENPFLHKIQYTRDHYRVRGRPTSRTDSSDNILESDFSQNTQLNL